MHTESLHARENSEPDRTGAIMGKGLGLFSIGLGIAELVAPRGIARLIGIDDCGVVPTTLRAFGAREIASGVGLLARPTSSVGPWSRVAGDLLDLAMLGLALGRKSVDRPRTYGAMAAVAGVAALDVFAGIRQERRKLGAPIRRATTIGRPAHEVYALWRDFERLPDFMTWVESVRDLGGGVSHWTVKTPAGATIEYDAEIVEDVPARRIAWRTLPGATVPNAGTVSFLDAPGGRGTEVIVELQVAAPLGKTIAGAEAQGDLRRFKQLLETGEVLYSDSSLYKTPHPARPDARGGVR